MREFTTPTYDITVKYRDGTIASNLEFDYVLFTLVNDCGIIEKKVMYEETTEGKFAIDFTQEETGMMQPGNAECELNFMRGEKRIASVIKRITISKNLHKGVITNDI